MKRLIGVGLLAVGCLSARSGVQCSNPDGTEVRWEEVVLAPESFTESGLRAYFQKYGESPGPVELFIAAVTDAAYEEIPGRPGLRYPFPTRRPLAYFFRFDDDCFGMYLEREGPVHWFTLRGENLLHRRFGETEVTLAMHRLRVGGTSPRCAESSRQIVLLAEAPRLEDLAEAARFYESRFPRTGPGSTVPNVDVTIYSSRIAIVLLELLTSYPGLELMDEAMERHQQRIVEWEEEKNLERYPPPPPPVNWGWICRLRRWGPEEAYLRIRKDNVSMRIP